MKKGLFVLAVLVMALGNVSFAQRKAELKSNANANVLKHYGVRSESNIVPQTAQWTDAYNDHFRVAYTYDEYDYYLMEEFYERDEGDGWMDYYRVSYDYDFYGNVIEMVGEMADMTGGMINDYKASYTYDGDELSEVIYQYWSNGNWVNDTKEVYNYNGDVTTVLYWEWNGNNWSSDELFTYTRTDNTIELVMQYMEGGAWQNEGKQIITLNFNERVTEILEQEWEGTSWVNDELTTYNFEGDVFPSKTIQEWNGSAWEDNKLFTYEYDENGNAKHGESKEKLGSQWMIADGDIEMFFGDGNKIVYYGYIVDVEYVDLTSVNENNAVPSFMVYPVPAHGEVFIEADGFQKAEIYGLTGQKLVESLSEKMNVSSLSQGVYLLKVYDREGNSQTQRIIVK